MKALLRMSLCSMLSLLSIFPIIMGIMFEEEQDIDNIGVTNPSYTDV
jgi:hypothetical protein